MEKHLGSSRNAQIPHRTFKLPISWNNSVIQKSIAEYTAAVRAKATYLPDNVDYVERLNAMKSGSLLQLFLTSQWLVIYSGFYMATLSFVNIDPRRRIRSPKWNPPRGVSPEGTIGYGGASACIYNGELPGGYQMFGRTMIGWDFFSLNDDYPEGEPWIYKDFDVFEFELVSEAEYNKHLADFHGGQYEYKFKNTVFDMGSYNDFLERVAHELPALYEERAAAAAKLERVEADLFAEWQESKLKAADEAFDTVKKWKTDPKALNISAPMKANVWKVLVKEGDVIQEGQVVAILEAMKMEINVIAEMRVVGATVKIVAMPPGSIVEPGDPILFLLKE